MRGRLSTSRCEVHHTTELRVVGSEALSRERPQPNLLLPHAPPEELGGVGIPQASSPQQTNKQCGNIENRQNKETNPKLFLFLRQILILI